MESVGDSGEIDREALGWLVRGESVACSDEQRARLDAWLADPTHKAAYLRFRAAWSHADRLRRLQPFDGTVDPDLLRERYVPFLSNVNAGSVWELNQFRRAAELERGPCSSSLTRVLVAISLAALALGGIAGWVIALRFR